MKINFQPISNVLGALLVMLAICMSVIAGVAWFYDSPDFYAFVKASGVTFFIGMVSWVHKFSAEAVVNKREGYLIVTLSWLLMCLLGALPYFFSGVTDTFANCFFESVSGFTTTGASIFTDIESLPTGILLWRSTTHWIGGTGIIVLTVALFPLLGVGGIELFVAEAPGPTTDKVHPRIKETAKRLWFVYTGLTIILIVIFYFEGMSWFDAINHSFATMSTGGFSTKNASLAAFNSPLIEYTTILFMILAGLNFSLLYFLFKRRFSLVWANEEFRYYILFFVVTSLVLSIWANYMVDDGYEKTFRTILFSIVSLTTTTGFVTQDYTLFSPGVTMVFFLILFIGGCAGSTAGGIKIIRHIVFVKNTYQEFKRILHPRAIIRIKLNKEIVAPRILTHVLVFLLVYLIVFVIGTLSITITGLDFETALGGVATTLGNVGPSIGKLGPMNNFSGVSISAKYIFSFLMLLGRLELFSILIIFSPFFWRSN